MWKRVSLQPKVSQSSSIFVILTLPDQNTPALHVPTRFLPSIGVGTAAKPWKDPCSSLPSEGLERTRKTIVLGPFKPQTIFIICNWQLMMSRDPVHPPLRCSKRQFQAD